MSIHINNSVTRAVFFTTSRQSSRVRLKIFYSFTAAQPRPLERKISRCVALHCENATFLDRFSCICPADRKDDSNAQRTMPP